MPERLLSALDRAVAVLRESVANEGVAWLASEPWSKVAALRPRGPAPAIRAATNLPIRPATLITVRRDGLCDSNLLASPGLDAAGVELRIVDDRCGVEIGSLARALAPELRRAASERRAAIVAIVAQNCSLPAGWLAAVEHSIRALEEHDADWGVAGVSGIDEAGRRIGRVSEPWGVVDTLAAGREWAAAFSLDDHVVLLQAGNQLPLDRELPGFEGLGASFCQAARAAGRRCYVIDAPPVAERVGHGGRPVRRAIESREVRGQLYRPQRSQREVTLEYLGGADASRDASTLAAPFRPTCDPRTAGQVAPGRQSFDDVQAVIDRPIVLLGKGGGGSRLITRLAEDCGVFVGRVNVSGDCLDMVPAVYTGVLRAHDCLAPWQRDRTVPSLRSAASAMLELGWDAGRPWGFKVPESLLLLPEIAAAFPEARYLFLSRDPVSTCLRRSHITAHLDNPIGRVSLSAAYRAAGLPTSLALDEPVEIRSARVTLHQVGTALGYLHDRVAADRRFTIRFEDLVRRPADTKAAVASWLDLEVLDERLERDADAGRAAARSSAPPAVVREVERILEPITAALRPAPSGGGAPRA